MAELVYLVKAINLVWTGQNTQISVIVVACNNDQNGWNSKIRQYTQIF